MNAAREEKAEALALDILKLAEGSLTVRFRFLDRALGRLRFCRSPKLFFGTDGKSILYDPWYVLNRYREEPGVIARDLMHSLLHLVFRHPFVGSDIDRTLWGLACDIAVEETLTALGLDAARSDGQRELLTLLTNELGTLTAERVLRFLSAQHFSPEELERWRQLFLADQHGAWYAAQEPDRAAPEVDPELVWKEIARRMQTELEQFSENGTVLAQQLRALNRPRPNLRAFLRRFGETGEILRISEEELDLSYYTYGLSLYGNVPLVEPLEYREEKLIRDFVIAIDTSGSVRGETVQCFVQYVYDILTASDRFFSRTNLHILQCDDRIREDAAITCAEELEAYLSGLTILGLGETDFRPVFRHVSQLLADGAFQNLRGLLYFTDGKGIFPSKKPPFETAFVLHTENGEAPPVPVWAMQISITEEDLLEHHLDG